MGIFTFKVKGLPFMMTDSRTTVLCLTFLVLFISTRILKLVRGLKVRFFVCFLSRKASNNNFTFYNFLLVRQPSPRHQVSPMSSRVSGRTAS